MKKRKAQELGTAEREQIAQEFMFKINQAAEDDEEAVQNHSPAIFKLKMLPVRVTNTRVNSLTWVPRVVKLGRTRHRLRMALKVDGYVHSSCGRGLGWY